MSAAEADATILVVDDDPVVRRLVRKGLQIGGFGEALEAEDGEAAKAVLQEREVDLVLTDLLMPRLDGLGLIRWAAEHARGPLWIILSGVETFDVAVEAVRLGAFEFLSKPVHIRQLQVAVRNALGQRQLERDRERLFKELEESHRRLIEKVRELEDKSEVIRRDLQRAEVIQRALLPKEPPRLDGFSLQTFYRPGRYVGGDLYNVVRVTDRHVALYVADATGHGVSSAMLSVLFDRKLVLSDRGSTQPLSPARVLASVNRAICEERIAPGLFLTAAYCLLDTVGGQAVIALAGHPPAFLRRSDGKLQAFPRTGPALGLSSTASYAEEWFSLEPGDRLLLYTDGLLEGARGGVAGRAWLEDALTRGNGNAREVVELLGGTSADKNGDDEDRDDVTVLLLDAHPGVSRFDNGESARARERHAAAPVPKVPVVYYGESTDTSFVALRGRVSWVQCDAFSEAVAGLLDEGRTVIVDLNACEHMDSTALGTLHELVMRGNRGRGSLRLQNVTEPVRRLFEELSMSDVSRAMLEAAAPVPRDMEPLTAVAEPQGSQWRILRAHEALASLSARNRERFLAVVETIRAQITD
jgi:anti-anti-sigma factor